MKTKVLVIDDEEDYRLIIRDVLTAAGMEVKTVPDGLEGLAAFKTFAPDIVLVDWMMPRMDGEHFCKAARSLPQAKRLPMLMLTVKQTADEELQALGFGVDDFIIKPFQPEELVARIKTALEERA